MDESNAAAKRTIEPSSSSRGSATRARTASPSARMPEPSISTRTVVEPRTSTRVPEPLSYLPEHASPSLGSVTVPVNQVEIFRPVILPQLETQPEPRLHVSMTISEYEGLVQSIQGRFQQAQVLGQEQGVQAMREVVNQLVLLAETMYQEGRTLRQQYEQLEAMLLGERQLYSQWLDKTRQELKREAQDYVENYRLGFQKSMEEEKLRMQKAFDHDLTSRSQAAAKDLEEAKHALAEDFRRQRAEIKAQMEAHSQKLVDDYRKTADVSNNEHQAACERDYQSRAREYKTSVDLEYNKELSRLNSTIQTLRSDNEALQKRAINEERMEQKLNDLQDEMEKYREAYRNTNQELVRLKRQLEDREEQVKPPFALLPSAHQKTQENDRWNLSRLNERTPLYDTPRVPVMSQASLAQSPAVKISENVPAGWIPPPSRGIDPVQYPYGAGHVDPYSTGYGKSIGGPATVQPSCQQQVPPP